MSDLREKIVAIQKQLQYLIDEIDLSNAQPAKNQEIDIESMIQAVEERVYRRLKNTLQQDVKDQIKQTVAPDDNNLFSGHNSSLAPKSKKLDLSPSKNLKDMIEYYNKNGQAFCNRYHVLEADQTQDSIEMRRTKSNASVVLYRVSKGKFWVVEEQGYTYLLPNPREPFNRHNLEVVKAVFEDSNYAVGSSKIILELPAKLYSYQGADNQSWQLEEKGIISFIP
jgi:hypothetical protein